MLRARALEQAQYVLYYPAEALRADDRLHTLAGLGEASTALSEEIGAYKREIGFKSPYPERGAGKE